MNVTDRYRILYSEPATHMGGSVTSLVRLLSRLNRQLYEPVVLLWRPSELVEVFRAAGAQVLWLYHEPANRIAAAEGLAPTRDIAAALERYNTRLATAYRHTKAWLAVAHRNVGEAVRIGQLIREHRIDLVHLNNRLYDTRSAAIAAVFTHTPCVCHVRYFDPFYKPDRWLARQIKQFVFISRAVADDVRMRLPGVAGAIIYDGVAVPPEPPAERRRRVRAQWGLSDTDFVVGNVGRIVGWKGQAVFLRALARLAPQLPHLQALIVGDTDPPEDAQYLSRLQMLIRELGLSERVQFTGHCHDVPELMGALDAVAHTATLPEPFGLVVIEGMAAGRPVVASAAGGVLDIITDGQTGLLTPMADDVALAEALARIARDPQLARRLGDNGRAHVAAHFSVEQFAAAVESVYEATRGPTKSRNESRSLLMRESALSDQR